jgi:hypothetical protein
MKKDRGIIIGLLLAVVIPIIVMVIGRLIILGY